MGTGFSYPDDIPHASFEDDEFSGGFHLERVDPEHTPSNDRAAPEIEEASEADASVFKRNNIPSGTSPTPPLQPEAEVTDDTGNIDGTALQQIHVSDWEMVQITEDSINLLIGWTISNFSVFPRMAQAKLIDNLAFWGNISALVSDEENILRI